MHRPYGVSLYRRYVLTLRAGI